MTVSFEKISDQDLLWQKLYFENTNSHFFQSPMWSSLLTKLPSMKAAHVKMLSDEKAYIIPMIRSIKLGGLVSTVMSLPLGTTGGILSEYPVDSDVIHRLMRYIKKKNPLKFTVRCQNDTIRSLLEPYGTIEQINALTLNLDRPYPQIEADLFSGNKRKLVNRGRRRGVQISNEKSPVNIDAYCKLVQKVQQQKGWATTYPECFIREMLALQNADLWTAWIDEQLACAIVSFSWNNVSTAWQGILDRDLKDALSAQPMNFLYASMIQYYQEHEFTTFDMGYSLGIKSLEQYKQGFGCTETPMYFFTWKSPLYKIFESVKRLRSDTIKLHLKDNL